MLGALAAARQTASGQNHTNVFDYVVVGAGSSGCVIANRLSADPHTRVLLIEAGGPDVHPLIPVPGKWTSLMGTRGGLELLDRARSRTWRAEPQVAARPDLWRFERDERDGVRARSSVLLRRLGRRGRSPHGAIARSCRISFASEDNSRGASDRHQRGRTARRLRHDRSARRPSRVSRGGAGARVRRAPRLGFRRAAAGTGRRLLSEEHPCRPPPLRRRRRFWRPCCRVRTSSSGPKRACCV